MEIDFVELRKSFFQDAEEHLEAMESALSRLDEEATDEEALGAMFRSAHSLKGDSGALGFESIEKLLHSFETVLDEMRSGKAAITSDAVDIIGLVTSQIDQLIEAAKQDGPTPEGYENTISELAKLQAARKTTAVPKVKKPKKAKKTKKVEEPEDFFALRNRARHFSRSGSYY
jgi:two-component system chemotaxis sensor kinase CheA